MIDTVLAFQEWMKKQGLPLKWVELTITFPDEKSRYHFSCSVKRDICILDQNSNDLWLLNLMGTLVHLEVRE